MPAPPGPRFWHARGLDVDGPTVAISQCPRQIGACAQCPCRAGDTWCWSQLGLSNVNKIAGMRPWASRRHRGGPSAPYSQREDQRGREESQEDLAQDGRGERVL